MRPTIVVGDVHGMAEKLRRLIAMIDAWLVSAACAASPQFIFLGDYIDRGPDSKWVVDKVRAMQQAGAICLRGNHEQMMIDSTRSDVGQMNFLLNGGARTLESFGSQASFLEAREWMKTLPTFYQDELRYYVHAGVRPRTPLDRQDDETRLWIREEFLSFRGQFDKYVVHGHTPTITYSDFATPEILDNRCNVDTGAGTGAALSAAIFDESRKAPIHTLSAF
jgi:serine/threonine protein phosphatase 1